MPTLSDVRDLVRAELGDTVDATWTITDNAGNVSVCKGTIRAK